MAGTCRVPKDKRGKGGRVSVLLCFWLICSAGLAAVLGRMRGRESSMGRRAEKGAKEGRAQEKDGVG